MTPFISKIEQHTLPVKARKNKHGIYYTSTKTKYYYNNQYKWIVNFKTYENHLTYY